MTEEFWPEHSKTSKICTLMHGTMDKTFHTCFKESLFLRYKKIFKKAVKLDSSLRLLVHIFLGHDGCFWKINLRILWNVIKKNFQVKHGQFDSIIFLKMFSFERRASWFVLKIVFPIPTGRVGPRWWNNFLIVNITSTSKRKFWG